jgi:uncharacterized protein (TIGR03000 family)
LFHRLHTRWHSHYDSWGSSGGSWGSSGGSWGSSGGSSGGYQVVPTTPAAPSEQAPPEPPAAGTSAGYIRTGDAVLTVRVPADAKVFVNGKATKSTGTVRSYVSRNLDPGLQYTYDVRVEFIRDGQTVEESKTVQLTAGRNAELAFNGPSTAAATTLTLRVPEDAKVFLAGVETSASGSVRSYTTTKLNSGNAWDDYSIRVTVDRDGRTMTQEKSVTLVGGQSQEFSFDFDTQKVADAR